MSAPVFPTKIFSGRFKPGSLARAAIRALLFLTFIPLILMAGAAYLRARELLQNQVVAQMQNLVVTEMGAAQNAVNVKQIRLDRLTRRSDFSGALQTLLSGRRGDPAFAEARNRLIAAFNEFNREESSPIFNLLFVMDADGTILAASDAKLEGASLAASPFYAKLRESDHETVGVFDFAPFYPGQFSLVTVSQFRAPGGTERAVIGGISEEEYATAILKSLTDRTPSSIAYFVTGFGEYVALDPYTGGLKTFAASSDQMEALDAAFAPMKEPGADLASATVTYRSENGTDALAQAVWLEELNSGVVLEVPAASIFGHLNSLIPFTLIVVAVTGVFLVIAVSAAVNRVVRPILSLAEITSRFAQGNWQERAAVERNDEVGLLASSFNRMADQLSEMYRSLQEQVVERTRQIRTAAEVAQGLTTAFDLDELLKTTVRLIVERFGFYHAGIFLIDSTGKRASLRAAYGPSAEEMLRRGHHLEVGSDSIVGWASAHLKPRVAADVDQDPVHHKNPLLPETRSEAGFPIALGDVALGVLDVQSAEPRVFDDEMVIVLQTLANQIAAAIQNATLAESLKTDAPEVERTLRLGHEIARAASEREALEALGRVMKESPHPSVVIRLDEREGAEALAVNNPLRPATAEAFSTWKVNAREAADSIHGPLLVNELSRAENLPAGLARPLREIGCKSGAFLPVHSQGKTVALLLIGERAGQPLTSPTVRPYTSLTSLLGATLDKVKSLEAMQSRLEELEALSSFNRIAASTADVNAFYDALHKQVQRVIGDYSFVVALYDADTNSISIPYLYEDGNVQNIEPFPLGEGLTSILIRTRNPLLLVEDTERQALALGAKIHGKPAKSWMGVPLLVNEEPIGALIVQDLERERRFDERDLRFLNELGKQLAGMIHSVRLLDRSRRAALQLQTAAEIARDISGSLNLDELLLRAVNLIRDRFDFYHASVFLLDQYGENAVIREATGEAGAQLKRMGHKLGVGSKSIVGYVSGRGEKLVVNDALKDTTYYANPLLPDTRSEAALPLKVGERILGVLDVQSKQPYAFNEENLRTLEILADQLAVAVVNTELFAETQEHLSQHRLLHHITTTAASGSTLEEALDAAVKGLQVTLGGDRVSILLLDKERKTLEVSAAVGYSEEASSVRIPLGSGITGWAALHRKPLRVDDVTADPRYIQVSENTRSELALPLIYRNELLGVLNVESEQIAAYTENDEEMLGTLAGSLAAIIANARLLAQIRRQAERERLLYEVTSKIRRSADMQTILAATASELSRAVGARWTHIKLGTAAADGDAKEETSSPQAGAND